MKKVANEQHLDILRKGDYVWNEWRRKNIKPDLSEANLSEAFLINFDLREANLDGANLSGAKLNESRLWYTNLNNANLSGAVLCWADLSGADLSGANLSRANLWGVNLTRANLIGTSLTQANLSKAILVETNLERADLTDCRIYGISAWDLKLGTEKDNNLAIQKNLIITPQDEPNITVDNLEVAQFIYLLLKNKNIRDVIDTITSKVVLILGRFASERMKILDALREELRKRNYSPVLFDFEKPDSRDLTETISTLAHMARFIIADITDARSIPQELERIVPDLPSVPVQPLLQASTEEYSMFEHFKRYPWVLEIYLYEDINDLLKYLGEKVIAPAEIRLKLEKK